MILTEEPGGLTRVLHGEPHRVGCVYDHSFVI
jgi:hypothetical protein